jgi:hypothetical protein
MCKKDFAPYLFIHLKRPIKKVCRIEKLSENTSFITKTIPDRKEKEVGRS